MQLGLTIPLQKFLKMPKPPYGETTDLFFCWELHKVPDISRSTLIAVNASNRYALVFMGMKAGSWKCIEEIVIDGIEQALALEGYTPHQVESYLAAAGEPELTKTHGRKPVAGLNRTIDMLWWIDKWLDERQLFQPSMSNALNKDLCHAAGFEGRDFEHPKEFLREDMVRLGIIGTPPSQSFADLKPGEFVFYDTGGLSLNQKKALLRDCMKASYRWWSGEFDSPNSLSEQTDNDTFAMILDGLYDSTHFVLANQGRWKDIENRNHFEISFRTMGNPINHSLFVHVESDEMPPILAKYNLESRG